MPTQPVSFKRHRFPPDLIRLAVWLYFRFTLSFRDVEEILAERGIEAAYETVRCWSLKFGRLFAQNLRRSRPKPTGRLHCREDPRQTRVAVRFGAPTANVLQTLRHLYFWGVSTLARNQTEESDQSVVV
ncbi:MAG: hypothetical protein ACXWLQ_09315, partial [Rhizomicrobium sp.]